MFWHVGISGVVNGMIGGREIVSFLFLIGKGDPRCDGVDYRRHDRAQGRENEFTSRHLDI